MEIHHSLLCFINSHLSPQTSMLFHWCKRINILNMWQMSCPSLNFTAILLLGKLVKSTVCSILYYTNCILTKRMQKLTKSIVMNVGGHLAGNGTRRLTCVRYNHWEKEITGNFLSSTAGMMHRGDKDVDKQSIPLATNLPSCYGSTLRPKWRTESVSRETSLYYCASSEGLRLQSFFVEKIVELSWLQADVWSAVFVSSRPALHARFIPLVPLPHACALKIQFTRKKQHNGRRKKT